MTEEKKTQLELRKDYLRRNVEFIAWLENIEQGIDVTEQTAAWLRAFHLRVNDGREPMATRDRPGKTEMYFHIFQALFDRLYNVSPTLKEIEKMTPEGPIKINSITKRVKKK